jgi:hypothetical protein
VVVVGRHLPAITGGGGVAGSVGRVAGSAGGVAGSVDGVAGAAGGVAGTEERARRAPAGQ